MVEEQIKIEDTKKFNLSKYVKMFYNIIEHPRYGSILRSTQAVLTMLTVYYLGMNSMLYTQVQIEKYAYDICGIVAINHTFINPYKVININDINVSVPPVNYTREIPILIPDINS